MTQHSTRTVRRLRGLALVTAVFGAGLVSPGPAVAADEECWASAFSDLDGGGPDVVTGLPSYDLPGKTDAGAIVIYSNVGAPGVSTPSAPTATTLLTAEDIAGLTAQAGARFGSAVAVWLREPEWVSQPLPDRCADLFVGAPGQNVDGVAGAGEVYKLDGTADGFGALLTTYNETALGPDIYPPPLGGPQAGAAFGSAIAPDAYGGLVSIGEPLRDIHSKRNPQALLADAGRALVFNDDIPSTPFLVEQPLAGFGGGTGVGDRFGEVIKGAVVGERRGTLFGVPHADVGRLVDAGAVYLATPYADDPEDNPNPPDPQTFTQDSPGAGGSAEAGDRYGASLDYSDSLTAQAANPTNIGIITIGVPGEDVGNRKDAGSVAYAAIRANQQSTVRTRGLALTLTQDSPGIPGVVESGDQFGSAVLEGPFGTPGAQPRLAVSEPREDLGTASDAGMAYLGGIAGEPSVALVPPVSQRGAGLGMVGMELEP